MCCTKIKDAYKYGEEHGRVFVNHFSFADFWSAKLAHRTALEVAPLGKRRRLEDGKAG
jgi:hypothetical protein